MKQTSNKSETTIKIVSCDDCKHGVRDYADGYVYRDWSGCYKDDPKDLPKVPDPKVFWTYVTCKKNNKGLKYINLAGDCTTFEKK